MSFEVALTGNANVRMNYVNFEREFVVKLGIDVIGWTHEKFINPSEMSTSLPPLQKLSTALKDGSCHFVRLSEAAHRAREAAYNKQVADGAVTVRKEREDKGVPRGKRRRNAEDGGEADEDCRPASQPKRARQAKTMPSKSSEFVNDSDSDAT